MKLICTITFLAIAVLSSCNDNKFDNKKKPLEMSETRKEKSAVSAEAGIDHIGINVPDIDSATVFLSRAFGAKVIYESHSKNEAPIDLSGVESTLNVASGTKIFAVRMIKIGNGPNIELFEVHAEGQRNAIKSSDIGLQHFAIYSDSISVSIERFVEAGGKILSKPNPMLFPEEKGDHNYFVYGLTPWGTSVEFLTYPDKMPYENQTKLRRWKGGKTDK
ncbi:VOC family protein [[Flexibacter] sp. ATCC 35103]|uniref:VOC family protein n=1 Tax=[Flexibacter] sp. ATCC 35103 TaxID=1937528 RepID=UPI00197E2FB7|nr:VOC family protein [[Flexibacter] sp. ATCC 35103]